MTKFYDKGKYVQIQVGNETYRVPKGRATVRSNSEFITIRDIDLNASQFTLRSGDVEIPASGNTNDLGEKLTQLFHVTDYDPNSEDGLTMFDGTDTTIGFTEVTDQHEAIVTVVEGDVTGELTTTLDTDNNEVTVSSDNPDDDGILHVELLGANLSL